MNFDDIKRLVIKENGKPHKLSSSIYTKEILNWIEENIKGQNNIHAKLCCIAMNLTHIPICKNENCSNHVEFRGTLKKVLVDIVLENVVHLQLRHEIYTKKLL